MSRPRPSSLSEWVAALVELLLEIESGRRPARHIRPFLAPEIQDLVHYTGGAAPATHRGRILLQVHSDHAHAVVLLHHPDRTTALTLTIERDDRGWVVTDLGRPEEPRRHRPDPPSPPSALATVAWGRERSLSGIAPRWQVPAGWRRHREDVRPAA